MDLPPSVEEEDVLRIRSILTLKNGLRFAIVLLVVVGLGTTLRKVAGEITSDPEKQFLLRDARWSLLPGAAVLYAASLLPTAFYWYRILRRWDVPVGYRRAMAAHIRGHLGKYVPGKAMVLVLRVRGIAGPGVSAWYATVAAIIETLTMMAVGAAFAGAVVAMLPVSRWLVAIAAAVVVASTLTSSPPLLRGVLKRLTRHRPNSQDMDWSRYDARLLGEGWLWMTLTWLLIGGSFVVLVKAIVPEVTAIDAAIAAAAMALAVVAGFVSLLPGGAGVREWILAAILASRIGVTEALTAALLARVLFLGVELAAAAICHPWRPGIDIKTENRSQ